MSTPHGAATPSSPIGQFATKTLPSQGSAQESGGRTVSGEPRLGGYASPYQHRRSSKIWLWAVVAFAIQLAVWTGWLVFASHHRVDEVPLATAAGSH